MSQPSIRTDVSPSHFSSDSTSGSASSFLFSSLKRWFARRLIQPWDRFWFRPVDPSVLSVIRIGCGLMLLYSHLVLATDLMSWLGPHSWIEPSLARDLHNGTFGPADASRSYLWHITSPTLLWMHHGLVLLVTAAFAAGCLTRMTAPLAWFFQLMLVHRLTGSLFGLDQIVTYTAMYLALSPCGARFSLDAWWRGRNRNRGSSFLLPDRGRSVAANIASRLLQIHLCVIYLFGGLAKARGESWWDGTAMWYSVGNLEYQSIDMTWIANWPMLFSTMTHFTLFWEIFYVALIWPKLTRPFMLAGAVAIHGGIATFLGMSTFGLMMIIANMVFIDPSWIDQSSPTNIPLQDTKAATQ